MENASSTKSPVLTTTIKSAFTFTLKKPTIDTKPLQFGRRERTTTTQSIGTCTFLPSTSVQINSAQQASTFDNFVNLPATTPSSTSLFGIDSTSQNTSTFEPNNSTTSALPQLIENTFEMASNQSRLALPVFGVNQIQTSAFDNRMNTPPCRSTRNNVFGSIAFTHNWPTFGIINSEKQADNLKANSASSALLSFGGCPPALKSPAAESHTGFSFNASNTLVANVLTFGSSTSWTSQQFGMIFYSS